MKTTSQKDSLIGRQPHRKTTSQKEDLTRRQPYGQTTSLLDNTYRKTILQKDNQNATSPIIIKFNMAYVVGNRKSCWL